MALSSGYAAPQKSRRRTDQTDRQTDKRLQERGCQTAYYRQYHLDAHVTRVTVRNESENKTTDNLNQTTARKSIAHNTGAIRSKQSAD